MLLCMDLYLVVGQRGIGFDLKDGVHIDLWASPLLPPLYHLQEGRDSVGCGVQLSSIQHQSSYCITINITKLAPKNISQCTLINFK